MRLFAFLPLIVVPCATAAQDYMSAAEFDAYTRGKTFYYGAQGAPYGGEEYLENRRVRWSFLDGRCQEGEWYEDDGLICFVYEDKPDPQCWSFQRSGGGLLAQFENDPAQTQLYEMEQTGEPLHCLGPEIGV
ncbi:hypothetical protein XM53_11810 [Roseovarius atlanticus]|uniref:Uncharacterized protein n=1 Tax=Roseovarius atlanticus TaxID=1641875 RepID=A0A0T5NTQ8_9RHOB|nr:hypothetical protein [Roseovarius atlanticus]KRS12323.1 hypothetical protein XM53_11810 [Roseovarius atlanticus]